MKYKVAILQDKITKGGRFSVVARMVKNLNDGGITPDILTGKVDFNIEQTEKLYGYRIKANVKDYGSYNKHLPEYHILSFNKKVTADIGIYDWVINSSNTSHYLKHPNLTEYVHFPRWRRVLNEESLVERTGVVWLIKKIESLYINKLYQNSSYPNCSILANSEYTAKVFSELYPAFNEVKVIYPPIDIPKHILFSKKNRSVINLGRFHPSKKQLEIIKIAEKMPEYTFNVVGFVNKGDSYFELCRDYKESRGLDNVNLYPNISVEKRDELLSKSSFFLHMLHNEPFGISTVQGVAHGSIPIVPNSGGQREIVHENLLRFDRIEEIPAILKKLDSLDLEELSEIQKKIYDHIQKFNSNEFDKKFNRVIKKHVS